MKNHKSFFPNINYNTYYTGSKKGITFVKTYSPTSYNSFFTKTFLLDLYGVTNNKLNSKVINKKNKNQRINWISIKK